MTTKVLYIFDPLCGWCYGFSGVIHQLYQSYQDEAEFVPIVGGMVTGDRITTGAAMYEYISGAIPRLESTTGQKMGEEYLSNILQSNEVLLNSEPPCRAVMTVRQLAADKAMEFIHALQSAHFSKGKDFNLDSTYSALLPALAINEQAFFSLYESAEIKEQVQLEFDWVKRAKIAGFPCVVIDQNNQLSMIANGYTPYEELKTRFEKLTSISS